eukprot:gb/GECG01004172.1/.p1 GENE.gb/GECG01004172.1/~~gb/GECG01004172.1/.p1  ORF type:complete len:111 (+),score=5.46 gb/GECG01004172.1/:1-333(+)
MDPRLFNVVRRITSIIHATNPCLLVSRAQPARIQCGSVSFSSSSGKGDGWNSPSREWHQTVQRRRLNGFRSKCSSIDYIFSLYPEMAMNHRILMRLCLKRVRQLGILAAR